MLSKLNYLFLLSFLILIFVTSTFTQGFAQLSQPIEFCGVLPPHTASSSNPDSILFDRFGNSYDIFYEAEAAALTTNFCQAGYFDISFTGGPIELEETVCKVFEDLSALIQQRVNTNACGETINPSKVGINVTATQTGGVLGAGSPLYQSYALCDNVAQSTIYQIINGGLRRTSGGTVDLNPSPMYPWHTDWTTLLQ